MEPRETGSGETVYIGEERGLAASKAPFERVFADDRGNEPWGYACGHCESLDVAVDTMGRIVCNECGNTRKPEEWDAAHE